MLQEELQGWRSQVRQQHRGWRRARHSPRVVSSCRARSSAKTSASSCVKLHNPT
jgi:hypothetical protein